MTESNESQKVKPSILLYRGFSSAHFTFLKGRIVTGEVEPLTTETDGLWRNLINNKRRFLINGVPDIHARISFLSMKLAIKTDNRGFFQLTTDWGLAPQDTERWLDYHISLPELNFEDVISGKILVPSRLAQYGLITDIDDTVVHTGVSNKLKMVLKTMITNAYSKHSVRGAEHLYHLFRNNSPLAPNPIFYVSRSPWNLYDMLRDFFILNKFPRGPMLLRDPSTQRDNLKTGIKKTHKYESICLIMDAYPHLPFLLVGDSTELDAVIYMELKEKYKERILQIYIRIVENSANLKNLKKYAQNHQIGGSVYFFENYQEIHHHALSQGYLLA